MLKSRQVTGRETKGDNNVKEVYSLIFFVEKMREASQIFSTKNIGIYEVLTFEI